MNQTVNVAKGIAIASMVVGHVISNDTFLCIFIYKWHMPLFFFFSGYFFNVNKYSAKDFVIRKLKTIYFPFIFWSLLVLGLHNFLVRLNINPSPIFDIHGYKVLVYRIVFELRQYEPLLGTFWFLSQLLMVNLLAYVLFIGLKGKTRHIYYELAMLVVCSIASLILCKYHCVLYYNVSYITFLALACFICGKLLRNIRLSNSYVLILAVLVVSSSKWNFQEMIAIDYTQIIPYYITAVGGIIIIYNLSLFIAKSVLIGKVFSYLGKKSLSIMILHFAGFKLVSFLVIKVWGLPIDNMAEHPVIHGLSFPWQMLYIMIGIGMPLMLEVIYNRIKMFING